MQPAEQNKPSTHHKGALISANNISLQRDSKLILDNITLTLKTGEILTLIGPNGAGKTTLLRSLLKLTPPTSGTVEHTSNLRVGYLPQRLTPDPMLPLSVDAFLDLWPGRENRTEALSRTGAECLAYRPLAELSGGELQRVLLARALLNKPNLLALDEPAQALDIHGQAALYDLISQLRETTGCAVIMVSHDLHVVMGTTDKVLCLNKHLCCQGTPDAIQQDPAYQAIFGNKASAFALYHHHHDHTHDGPLGNNTST